MKREKPKHTMAVLRQSAGLRAIHMADLLRVSLSTVRSIEAGRLKLSEKLARRAEFETGVDAQWLLANEASRPIKFCGPQPGEPAKHLNLSDAEEFWCRVVRYIAVLKCATENRKGRLFGFVVDRDLEKLEAQFGTDKQTVAALSQKIR